MTNPSAPDDPNSLDHPADEQPEPSDSELLQARAARPKWSISRLAKRRLGRKKR